MSYFVIKILTLLHITNAQSSCGMNNRYNIGDNNIMTNNIINSDK